MKNNKEGDAFSHHILENMDPAVLASLSPAQLTAIKDAIKAGHPHKEKKVDIRGTVNLFFRRYYYVLWADHDRRVSKKEVPEDRRSGLTAFGNILFLLILLSGFLLMLMLLLHGIKILFGIDIFPEKGLTWLLNL